jgi:hypothetical protein
LVEAVLQRLGAEIFPDFPAMLQGQQQLEVEVTLKPEK